VRIVGEARERGLPLTLVRLFSNPTPRGASAGLAVSAPAGQPAPTSLLSPADQALVPPGVDAAYPATRLQLGMVYESLASDGARYVAAMRRTVNLPLEEPALRQALDLMSGRHPILRTRFSLGEFSEPVQLVDSGVTVPLRVEDFRGVGEAATAERYAAAVEALCAPFDPEQAPLLRVHAAALDSTRYWLSYSFHHAILDGWSESLFIDELARTYRALLAGEVPGGTAGTDLEPVPFEEYVRLEREAIGDPASRRYFAEKFAGRPAGGDAGAVGGDAGAVGDAGAQVRVRVPVPAPDAAALAVLTSRWGVPPKSMMLAVVSVAARALLRVDEPVIGLAVSGRPERAGADRTLGVFLNHLPVRLRPVDRTWRSLVEQALAEENGLLAHRRFPFAEIRALAAVEPFTVSLNYVHFHLLDTLIEEGLVTDHVDVRDQTNLPVRVEVIDEPLSDGTSLQVTADVSRFGAGLPKRFVDLMLAATHNLAADPDGPVDTPEWRELTADQRR